MANWSIILNVLLLIGVIFAIARLMQVKRKAASKFSPRAPMPQLGDLGMDDDIIAVRKIDTKALDVEETVAENIHTASSTVPNIAPDEPSTQSQSDVQSTDAETPSVHLFLLAKDDKQFAGYELLQAILAAGLRFGEGQLFHRHQHKNGQGPIICSLATATTDGTFDLQNIGGFSVRGLCMFMDGSGNDTIDAERLEMMIETAKQLAEGLDAHLLDDARKPWTNESVRRYQVKLCIDEYALSDI